MDLIKLMRSLEEFVFEAIALLFFYPKTLLRIAFKPLQAMQYAEQEEAKDDGANPYDDAVSPPLLLLITLLVANGIGLALHKAQPPDASHMAKALLDSPQNLLMFRSLLFSIVPLTAAVLVLRLHRQATSRTTLRQPFFAQCYLTSPFALVISLGLIAVQTPGHKTGGAIACAVAFAWMLGVQATWFRVKLRVGMPAAFGMALGVLAWSCICVVGVVTLIATF